MRHFILILFVVFVHFANAQNVITFFGIPIDGDYYTFEQKLKDKGFSRNKTLGGITGVFEGKTSDIVLLTENHKVYGVVVSYIINEIYEVFQYNMLIEELLSNKEFVGVDINMCDDNFVIPKPVKDSRICGRVLIQSSFNIINCPNGLIEVLLYQSCYHDLNVYLGGVIDEIRIVIRFINLNNWETRSTD